MNITMLIFLAALAFLDLTINMVRFANPRVQGLKSIPFKEARSSLKYPSLHFGCHHSCSKP